jgi:hypothetical protein
LNHEPVDDAVEKQPFVVLGFDVVDLFCVEIGAFSSSSSMTISPRVVMNLTFRMTLPFGLESQGFQIAPSFTTPYRDVVSGSWLLRTKNTGWSVFSLTRTGEQAQ